MCRATRKWQLEAVFSVTESPLGQGLSLCFNHVTALTNPTQLAPLGCFSHKAGSDSTKKCLALFRLYWKTFPKLSGKQH